MAPKTEQERLFGASCVRVMLERGGLQPQDNEIYQGTLADLGLEDSQVLAYLENHRSDVERALDQRGGRAG